MSLQIIGAGWGRTGTESLKKALEYLDFDNCYHMFELMKHPEHLALWEQLEQSGQSDFELLFNGYKSGVDFPVALYYRELIANYPDAKVILTVRDADKWYDSASKTILKGIPPFAIALGKLFGVFSKSLRVLPAQNRWIKRILYNKEGLFQGKKEDREFMKSLFKQWNDEVKKTVPEEKLLVFEVKDGWEPLCKFLNVPVPTIPFPRSNEGVDFQKNMRKRSMGKEV